MLAALTIGWKDELLEGLAGLTRRWAGRVAMVVTALLLLAGVAAAADRVSAVRGGRFDPNGGTDPAAIVAAGRMDRKAPALGLVDQHGEVVRTEDYRGTLLVTLRLRPLRHRLPGDRDLPEARQLGSTPRRSSQTSTRGAIHRPGCRQLPKPGAR
jgi:hypothetical protein